MSTPSVISDAAVQSDRRPAGGAPAPRPPPQPIRLPISSPNGRMGEDPGRRSAGTLECRTLVVVRESDRSRRSSSGRRSYLTIQVGGRGLTGHVRLPPTALGRCGMSMVTVYDVSSSWTDPAETTVGS